MDMVSRSLIVALHLLDDLVGFKVLGGVCSPAELQVNDPQLAASRAGLRPLSSLFRRAQSCVMPGFLRHHTRKWVIGARFVVHVADRGKLGG